VTGKAVRMADAKRLRPTRQEEGEAIARSIDWTHYDRLKAQGLADREIARRFEIPWASFCREKQKHGALDKRVPQQTPGVSKGVSNRVSARVSQGVPVEVLPSLPPAAGASDMNPLLHDILQELRTLTQGLAGRVSPQTPQVSVRTPQVSQGVSLAPREKTERWNLHLPQDLIVHIKAKAHALGVHPSELVAEVLRRWLAEEA
jgi:hypothetical protein